jgi:hypothetical protein
MQLQSTPMVDHAAAIVDGDAQRRWEEWQARGAEADRRSSTRMRIFMLVVAMALAVWSAVLL